MKVPPLIINLKNIEKHDKDDQGDKHEKHDKHKEHKKHKKHKKHKHKHHHHDHDHSSHHNHNKEHKEFKDKPPVIKILNPPLLEPVVAEPEHHLYPYQSTYGPPSPVPYPHVLHPVPTPPSQIEQKEKEKEEAEAATGDTSQSSGLQPPILHKAVSEPSDDSKQSDDSLAKLPPSLEPVNINSIPELTPTKSQEPNSQMSYLKMSEDGTVRLKILAPMRQADEGNERILNLEQVCGQLQDGLDVIPSDINEDECKEQMQLNPVDYVETPVFGSHLPMKDSTFANLTKEDSETLLEVYGGNATTFEYAESLQNYASGTNYLMKMVDSLLDLLTEGNHNKEAVPIRQKEKDSDEVQQQLNEIEIMLADLRNLQEQRLSSSPAPIEPGEAESNLADELLAKMTKLIKEKAKPSEICESSSILKALGIPLDAQS